MNLNLGSIGNVIGGGLLGGIGQVGQSILQQQNGQSGINNQLLGQQHHHGHHHCHNGHHGQNHNNPVQSAAKQAGQEVKNVFTQVGGW